MPLKEQRMHLNAALERNSHRIRAQQDRLNELLDELEQANLANEQLQLDCEQLRMDNEQIRLDHEQVKAKDIKQEILISTLRFTNKDQKVSLQRAENRIAALDLQKAALQRQNAGLATKIMAQQRQMFTTRLQTKKLEREKLGQQDLMEEISSIKTLVANSLYATNPLGKPTRRSNYEIVPARKDTSQVPITTPPLSTPSNASSAQAYQRSLGESLDPGSRPSSQLSLEEKNPNVRTRFEPVDEAAQTERRVRKRIIRIVDAGLSRCRAQGWFRDEFDFEQYDSEVEIKDYGTTGIRTVMEMVYKEGV